MDILSHAITTTVAMPVGITSTVTRAKGAELDMNCRAAPVFQVTYK